ncbi:MAG: glycosyltransferase family 4 protein [Pseudomonadota bacterium]
MAIAYILKGYPRLSETFIAQEIAGMEARGWELFIVSLRHPTDPKRHPIHARIKAQILYLPEYLSSEPWRVIIAFTAGLLRRRFWHCFKHWWADFLRDPTRNRIRRFGQALVLVREMPDGVRWLHFHFAHTPACVTRYASLLTGLPLSGSAHAKDIWTTPLWNLQPKLQQARFIAVCTQVGEAQLREIAPSAFVRMLYHGLDLAEINRLAPRQAEVPSGQAAGPVRILSVGRLVEKKGYNVLLQALALLPSSLDWHFTHIGPGDPESWHNMACKLGVAKRISWAGPEARPEVLRAMQEHDLFVLASQRAASGDRDGLPNVLLEAASQRLPLIASDFSAIPELIEDGVTGRLVEPGNATVLAQAIEELCHNHGLREQLAANAYALVVAKFDADSWLDRMDQLFQAAMAEYASQRIL